MEVLGIGFWNLRLDFKSLTRDPGNRDMQENVQRMRATLAADVQRIDDCKYKPGTNSCTKELLDTCEHMVLSTQTAEVHKQFL